MTFHELRAGQEFPRPGQPNLWYKAAAGVSVAGALTLGILVAPLTQGTMANTDQDPGTSRTAKSDAMRASLEALAARQDRIQSWIVKAQDDLSRIGTNVADPAAVQELRDALADAESWQENLVPAGTPEAVESQVSAARMIEDRITVRLNQCRDSNAAWLAQQLDPAQTGQGPAQSGQGPAQPSPAA